MKRLWAWYWAWTVADIATTMYFYHAGVGSELNPLINALTPIAGFDAACITAALASTALLWLLMALPRRFYNASRRRGCATSSTFLQRLLALLPVAAKTIIVTRFVAPLSNLLLIATGLGLVDLFVVATGLPVYQAYFALVLLVVAPAVIYYYRRAPPPPRVFPISPADAKA